MRSRSLCVRWLQMLPAVLVIGGCEDRSTGASGKALGPTFSVVPGSGTWIARTPMPTARISLGVTTTNGIVYAVGGGGASGPLAAVEAYDPGTDTWTTKASMPTGRIGLGVDTVEGILYAVGGLTSASGVVTYLPTVEAYNPATDVWTTKTSMPTPRFGPGVAAMNGILYVVGGGTTAAIDPAPVEAYDPATNTWTTRTSMPTARMQPGVVVVNGILYVVGGVNASGSVATVEAYNPSTDTWSTKKAMSTARYALGLSAINGVVYAVGGANGCCVLRGTVEAYDPATDTWTTVDSMPTARAGLGVAAVNGILYAVGGLKIPPGGGEQALATVEAFNPAGVPPANQPPTAIACVDRSTYVTSTDQLDCAHSGRLAGHVTPPNSPLPTLVLRGDRSSDPDHDALTFKWTEGSTLLGTEPVVDVSNKLGPGQHAVVLTVDDGRGGTAQDQVVVTVTPLVILVHGWNGSPSSFGSMGDLLGNLFTVLDFDYSTSTGLCSGVSIQRIAEEFGGRLQTWVPPGSGHRGSVNVLAHSMGGLVVQAYMVGFANPALPYGGEIGRIIMAGTPNYGTPLGQFLVSVLQLKGCAQVFEMAYSSDFLWNLHGAWEQRPPLTADRVLGIAGAVLCPGLPDGSPLGSKDGIVTTVSVPLPESGMSTALYVPYKHYPGTVVSVLADQLLLCPQPELVRPTSSDHWTYQIARAFFQGSSVPIPPDPRPTSIDGLGLVLMHFIDPTGGPIFAELTNLVLHNTSTRQIAACVNTGRANVTLRCYRQMPNVTLLDLPAGEWVMTAIVAGGIPVCQTITSTASRPTEVVVTIRAGSNRGANGLPTGGCAP
jgi:N-acetylneuraminic acid mutarotase/pimeloyl-ACP methyl ester carboxylesterase